MAERWVIASGKGGTGKTTLATGLACALAIQEIVQYADCDVEEPNGRLYLKPMLTGSVDVTVKTPVIDDLMCTRCGLCGRFCRYGAIACLLTETLVFSELCHGCGGCRIVCPHGAITETDRVVGVVTYGVSSGIRFVEGRLNVGETMSPAVVRAVLRQLDTRVTTIIDAPPGASCPVAAALSGADRVILVTEPTSFGLHDLSIVLDLVQSIGVRCGVVINRCDTGDDRVERYCRDHGVPVWAQFPYDRTMAECSAQGGWNASSDPVWLERLHRLTEVIREGSENA